MNALKAISKTDDELRVGNYIVLYGGRDLEGIITERKNPDGTRGEYFTKATQFDSPYTKTGVLYLDWEHGLAEPGEPQRDDVLGYVDWRTAKSDDTGLWVERVLDRHNRYMHFLEQLIEEGIIGSSTEPVQGGVAKGQDGEIKSWPLKRDTLTAMPMEPRMKTQNTVQAIKGLSDVMPSLKSVLVDESDTGAVTTVTSEPDAETEPEQPATNESQPATEMPAVDIAVTHDDEVEEIEESAEDPAPEAQSAEPTPEPEDDLDAFYEIIGDFIDIIEERIGRLL